MKTFFRLLKKSLWKIKKKPSETKNKINLSFDYVGSFLWDIIKIGEIQLSGLYRNSTNNFIEDIPFPPESKFKCSDSMYEIELNKDISNIKSYKESRFDFQKKLFRERIKEAYKKAKGEDMDSRIQFLILWKPVWEHIIKQVPGCLEINTFETMVKTSGKGPYLSCSVKNENTDRLIEENEIYEELKDKIIGYLKKTNNILALSLLITIILSLINVLLIYIPIGFGLSYYIYNQLIKGKLVFKYIFTGKSHMFQSLFPKGRLLNQRELSETNYKSYQLRINPFEDEMSDVEHIQKMWQYDLNPIYYQSLAGIVISEKIIDNMPMCSKKEISDPIETYQNGEIIVIVVKPGIQNNSIMKWIVNNISRNNLDVPLIIKEYLDKKRYQKGSCLQYIGMGFFLFIKYYTIY